MAAITSLVPYFRNANWYYDNYFIQKTLAGQHVNELISMKKIVDKLNAQVVEDSSTIAKMRSDENHTFVSIGIMFVVVIGAAILLMK